MQIKHAGWVVVADAGRFLVLENRGDGELIDLRIRAVETRDSAKTSDIGTDRPGRLAEVGSRRVATVETDGMSSTKRPRPRI